MRIEFAHSAYSSACYPHHFTWSAVLSADFWLALVTYEIGRQISTEKNRPINLGGYRPTKLSRVHKPLGGSECTRTFQNNDMTTTVTSITRFHKPRLIVNLLIMC